MDIDLLMIMMMIVSVAGIIGFSALSIVKRVYDHKRWEQEHSAVNLQSKGKVLEIVERTEMIEDRLRVLERLATDRGTLLSDEIESLRDQRREREGA